ncbi:disease resistance protein Roq1-like [Macadamia integrifolia]|uniref:disease resistance protein Roq1-like n=1 Tax=Macadamia integrifolia TaxID=60698 RepID=UPI001C52D4FD|nr:disease resistance protein Roq1-like [Macadamia integrifolia]
MCPDDDPTTSNTSFSAPLLARRSPHVVGNFPTHTATTNQVIEERRGPSASSLQDFSKGYANSKWCLRELAQMLYCRRHYGQIILPIFFDVDPSDFAPGVVESWKEALRQVGNLKGWVLKEVENGDESKLVELLVERVLKETCIHNIFSMSDVNYRIGLDSHLKNLLYLLNIGSKDVQFIGIYGICGIVKTTIAKALYNCIIESFDQNAFLKTSEKKHCDMD